MLKKNINSPDKRIWAPSIWNSRATPPARMAFRLSFILGLSVFIVEGVIMLGLPFLGPLPPWLSYLLDPIFLIIILAPILYFFLFHPLALELEEHNSVEKRMHHLNATLQAIRNVNQLITRAKDRDTLLQGTCNFLVETRGFHNAWIVFFDRSKRLEMTYQAGLGESFQAMVEQLRQGRLPECCRKALEQPGVFVTQDPASQCSDCPLAQRYEGSAGMTVRLEYKDRVYGLLTVSLPKIYILDQEDRNLVAEVGGDLSYVLHNLELGEERRQAQKMEAIGTLAGGIAHDFNNILGAIIGMSELALLGVEEGASLHRHITQVLKAADRAKDLVKQILAFSRQREREEILLSMKPVVKEALKLLRSSLPSTIEMRQYIETDPGLIKGDPTQIYQVLMNLCANAEYAMREEGGVLEVGIQKVDLGMESEKLKIRPDLHPGVYVCLSVSDTGHGITPEAMNRIFDPYFTTKGAGEGTGLGLAVVQGIVHKHGGAITVESEPGRGTTFRVYFPKVEGEKQAIREDARAPLAAEKERILFVDDEEVLTYAGKGILEGLGYEVTTKTNSLEALELFKAKPGSFDLVITDMSMPNMTGAEFSQELMKIRSDIPIILCTGFSHIISEEKAHQMGIRAFIMKPLIRKDLAETVRKVLDG